jgi:hypothetical protein
MTWKQFTDLVRTHLLVDAQRKGTGVQNYINQMIRAGAIDLQRFVPQLLNAETYTYRKSPDTISEWSSDTTYKFGDVVKVVGASTTVYQAIGSEPWNVAPPSTGKWVEVRQTISSPEGAGVQGEFKVGHTNITSAWIRKWPTTTNKLTKSDYYPLDILDWSERYEILDGGPESRTKYWPGRIAFGPSYFVTDPKLADDEKLMIFWEGEKHEWGDAETVLFDAKEAEAVANYVKAHLQREVDRDLKMFESHLAQYKKQRQEIYRERRSFTPTEANDLGIASNVVGQIQ